MQCLVVDSSWFLGHMTLHQNLGSLGVGGKHALNMKKTILDILEYFGILFD